MSWKFYQDYFPLELVWFGSEHINNLTTIAVLDSSIKCMLIDDEWVEYNWIACMYSLLVILWFMVFIYIYQCELLLLLLFASNSAHNENSKTYITEAASGNCIVKKTPTIWNELINEMRERERQRKNVSHKKISLYMYVERFQFQINQRMI